MKPAKLLETKALDPNEIHALNRIRPVSAGAVDALVISIKQLGLVKDEIHVRRVRHQNNKLVLIAGGHRLEACLRLNMEVPAKVWECSDDWAKLMEVDDNLASAELSPLDLCFFLAERKRISDKMSPEKTQGNAGASARWHATDIVSFASDIASKRGMSERHIRRLIAVGSEFSTADVTLLRAVPNQLTLRDLQDLSKSDPDGRPKIIQAMVNGAKTAAKAMSATGPKAVPPGNQTDIDFKRLSEAWHRASKKARTQFVAEYLADLAVHNTDTSA